MLFIIVVAFFVSTNQVIAKTLYLDADATGSRDGTSWQNAFTTITQAASVAEHGDTVLIRNGNYGTWENNAYFPTYTGSLYEPLPAATTYTTFKAASGHTEVNFTRIEFGKSSKYSLIRYSLDGLNVKTAGGKAEVLLVGCVGVRIKNSTHLGRGTTELDGNAIKLGSTKCNDVIIENCNISNYANAIKVYGHNVTIKDNTLYTMGSDYISIDSGNNTLVEGNYMDDSIAFSGAHPDGIVMAGTKTNVIIRGNIVADNDTQGIYCTGGNTSYTNVLIENNLLYNISGNEFQIRNIQTGTIRHNTIIGDRGVANYSLRIMKDDVDKGNSNISVYNNLFLDDNSGYGGNDWESAMAGTNHDYNIFIRGAAGQYEDNSEKPYSTLTQACAALFSNVSNRDYSLKAGSFAIDFGTAQWGYPATDIAGNPRDGMPDAGCYEYSTGVEDNTPPSAPQGLNANATSETQIYLSWQASVDPESGISYYNIYRDGNKVGTSSSAAYVDTGLTSNTSYIYEVSAVNGAAQPAESQYSTAVQVSTLSGTPAPGDGLVGFWEFEEGSGLDAQDSSGNSNTATLASDQMWSGLGEVNFDGIDDYVEIPTSGLDVSNGTIAMWVRVNDLSQSMYFFGHTVGSWSNRIQLYADAGSLALGLGDSHSLRQNIATLQTQRWYHLCLTWDGTNYTVYLDGTSRATGSYTGFTTLDTLADIGNTGNPSYRSQSFDGLIDNVRVYNEALSGSEIQQIYEDGGVLAIKSVRMLYASLLDVILSDESFDVSQLSQNPNDYTISGPEQVTVSQVSLDTDNNRVRLFTSPHSKGSNYTLTTTDAGSINYTFDNGLVGDWRFEGYIGTEAKDTSGNNNAAVLVNGTKWTGQGDVSLDGNDDAVQVPTTHLSADNGTITLWVYSKDLSGGHYLFSHLGQDDNSAIQLYTIGTKLWLSLGARLPDYIESDIVSLVPQTWYNIALTWDGAYYTVYVDGIAKASGQYSGLTAMDTYADIGNDGNNRLYALNGYVDDVRFYDRALSAVEISDQYVVFQIKENKNAVAIELDLFDAEDNPITYTVQNQPSGASFDQDTNTFEWIPWYDQAGAYEVTFVQQDQPQNTETHAVIAENVELSDWYQQWLENIELL
jgi:hypothetical protein